MPVFGRRSSVVYYWMNILLPIAVLVFLLRRSGMFQVSSFFRVASSGLPPCSLPVSCPPPTCTSGRTETDGVSLIGRVERLCPVNAFASVSRPISLTDVGQCWAVVMLADGLHPVRVLVCRLAALDALIG